MKTLQNIFEDFFKNVGSTPEDNKKRKIEDWLKEYNIKNYTINKDLTIDVNGSVNLSKYSEKELPEYIQFNEIDGNFVLNLNIAPPDTHNIESLRGFPKKVNGDFNIDRAANIASLEGAPKYVGRDFKCSGCNKLLSLKGGPEVVKGSFFCSHNPLLTNLEGSPKEINVDFWCIKNNKLKSLKNDFKVIKGDCFLQENHILTDDPKYVLSGIVKGKVYINVF